MHILSKADCQKPSILAEIKAGAVFIYPTDTIYGFGCDATNDKAIKRIRELKQREAKPFSIIAPSFEWIHQNCIVSDKAKAHLVKLPGPCTLILPLKTKAIAASVNNGGNTVGVRIPNHWIATLVERLGRPIVTTSVNKSGLKPCTQLDQFQKFAVDFIIYEGDKAGSPSTVIDLVGEPKIIR